MRQARIGNVNFVLVFAAGIVGASRRGDCSPRAGTSGAPYSLPQQVER